MRCVCGEKVVGGGFSSRVRYLLEGDAKVGELDHPVLAHQYVAALQISVNLHMYVHIYTVRM